MMLALASASCYKPIHLSIPSISEPVGSWLLETRCASQGCVEKADVLMGDGIRIEIEPYNRGWSGARPFYVALRFEMPSDVQVHLTFSRFCLRLEHKQEICARGVRNASFHSVNPQNPLKAEYLGDTIALPDRSVSPEHKQRTVGLVFDLPTPDIDQRFRLSLGGVSKNGEPIKIPALIFAPGQR